AIEDLLAYTRKAKAGATGMVFDPNPVITSGKTNLSWSNGSALDALRTEAILERLNPPDSEGRYQLGGTYVFMENLPDPTPKGPTSKDGRFVYGAKDPRFLNVMAYHHIDRFQEYVQTTLGLAEY